MVKPMLERQNWICQLFHMGELEYKRHTLFQKQALSGIEINYIEQRIWSTSNLKMVFQQMDNKVFDKMFLELG
eukprot:c32501_g1_i1 orf=86-304(+)